MVPVGISADVERQDVPPPGFVEERQGACRLWVREQDARALAQAGFSATSEPRLESSDLAGRRPLLELATKGETLLVRRFTHGGLLRWLTGRRFLDPARPFRELRLSEDLRRRGIRTPQIVAARARPASVAGWTLELVSRRVESVVDLAQVLERLRKRELVRRRVAPLLVELGRFLRRLHDEGLYHADLQPANLLVNRAALEGEDIELWVLDLDRSRLGPPLAISERCTNLARLLRHVLRRSEEQGPSLARTDWVRVLRGYEPQPSSRPELWGGIDEALTQDLGRHRAGWWLERRLGRDASRRS